MNDPLSKEWTEWVSFNSTNLHSGRYAAASRTLQVRFLRTHALYEYGGVEEEQWQGLCDAAAPGQFFLRKIIGRGDYREVREEVFE